MASGGQIVTGEAVALDLQPATFASRAVSGVLDLMVQGVGLVVVLYVGSKVAFGLDDAAGAALILLSTVAVVVGYPLVMETLTRGRTLGKMAMGLRTVRDDGGPIRFRHALVRGAIGMVEILMTFGVVACIASLVSARGRRLGDVFAGTLVVRERIPVGGTGSVPLPPPWLAGRFSGLDLSAVPDALWLAVRQYLTRMGQLDPRVSWGMAERLAGDLAARTGTRVPQDLPPAVFLAAVAQERRAREARRTAGAGMGAGVPGVPGGGYVPSVPPPPAAGAPAPPPVVPSAGGVRGTGPDRPATGFVPPA
jgi:uncharacterized RDD family membrane protein YckC